MNSFDGHEETVHLERGQSFGLSPRIYQCLAEAAISAQEHCGIEPIMLEAFSNGPGAVCTLYGKVQAYQIEIYCHPPEAPPMVVSKILAMDDPQAAYRLPVFGGKADAFATWQVLVSKMLEAEGFVGMSLPELEAWNREHGYL